MKGVLIATISIGWLGLAACGQQEAPEKTTVKPQQSAVNEAQPNSERIAQFNQTIHRHLKVLAADEFEGRAPATPGGKKTINYLKQQFESMGLSPGNGDSFLQRVPVAEIITDPAVHISLSAADYSDNLAYGKQMMVATQQQQPLIEVKDSDMVFVGYGINAPERNWNDYAGLDVRGKTVVILVNDPGFITQDPDNFNGNAMTYYGRWTYKYEEAARQGAAAALIIHETAPAGYPWEVVANSWSGPQIHLQAADKGASKAQVEGWLHLDAAKALLASAGLDHDTLKRQAAQPGFKAIPLNAQASMTLENQIRYDESYNVIAKLEGTEQPDEYFIYMAHWDHLGRDPSREGDQIFNGAIDNGTGTAALLALAEAFKNQPTERTLLFIAVTAEESGLLGSKYYGENPIYPLNQTVGAINMDAMNALGPVKDLVVIGDGFNQIQNYLTPFLQQQGRYAVPDEHAEKGYYFRSDHFSLAKFGVPALFAEGGNDSVEHGKEWGRKQQDDYTANRYHKPSDEYSKDMDLRGAAMDVDLFFSVGQALANSDNWPQWNEGSEFKAIREASLNAKN